MSDVRTAARRIGELLEGYLEPLHALASAVGEVAETTRARGEPLTEAALTPVLPSIEAVVREREAVAGHGFVAAPGVVGGSERYLLWLQQREHEIRRLRLNFDTRDVDVYDYHAMEWYTAARTRHAPVLFGPYVDYTGSNLFVLTVTVPVLRGDEFLGVAGADLLASAVEAQLVRQLKAVAGDAVIVNGDRTVVATNSARWLPGERMRRYPATDPAPYVDVASIGEWTGWVVALARQE